MTTDDGSSGYELWKSDGTEIGTVQVKDIRPGLDGSNSAYLTIVGGTLYFTANDRISGQELWRSDGTAAGTTLVKDIQQGDYNGFPYSSNPSNLTNVDGTLFFTANDAVHGDELWTSNGTELGTLLVDLNIGSLAPAPSDWTAVGSTHFFIANDGLHGRELWKVEQEPDDTTSPAGQGLFSTAVPVETDEEQHHFVNDPALTLSEELTTSGAGNIADPTNWLLTRNEIEANSQIAGISFSSEPEVGRYEALVSFNPRLTDGG